MTEAREPLTPREQAIVDDPPPVGGSWGRIYAAIILYLVALIIAFGVFTAVFNR